MLSKEKKVEQMQSLAKEMIVAMFGTPIQAANAAKNIKQYMDCHTDRELLFLSEQFRNFTNIETNMLWEMADPKERQMYFSSQGEYAAVLQLGTLHPNGYFRQRCVLAAEGIPYMLPFLFLRCNDWISAIRKCAMKQVKEHLKVCNAEELLASFPYMEKVERSGRRECKEWKEQKELFYTRLHQLLPKIDETMLFKQPYERRKVFFWYLCRIDRGQKKSLEEMNRFLELEKNGYLKCLLIQKILADYSCSDEIVEQYLKNRDCSVRRYALYEKFHRCFDAWDGLEEFLLDPSHAIREYAVYVLKKYRQMDINTYYCNCLETDRTVYAVIGLGENAGSEYAVKIEKYLSSPKQKLVRITLTALERMLGRKGEKIYLSFLTDQRVAISKTAYLCIRRSGLLYGPKTLYEIVLNTKQEHIQHYAILLLLLERSWKRMPYLLMLYQAVSNEKLKEEILSGLWNRNMYETVLASQADEIRRLLDETDVPEGLKNAVRFDLSYVEKR